MVGDRNRKQDKGNLLAFDFVEQSRQIATIRVVGVGGAGGNAVNRMIEDGVTGVEFYVMNTDLQALDQSKAPYRIQIGKNLTKGLGAGGNPEMGRKAIEENKDAVIDALSDSDMVFITCGMGGGTGTGAAPVVAEIARDLGALTVGIVTRPFEFEGAIRKNKAEKGLNELKEVVDTLIVVPNQKLLSLVPRNTPLDDAFRIADEILMHAAKGISDVINKPGLVNVDFADVRTVMSQMGDALMGSGIASGENRAQEAAEKAIANPMIEDISISGALGVLVNITGGSDLTLNDISEATTVIQNSAGENANIIFGAVKDPSMNGELRVTVIATGFQKGKGNRFGTGVSAREFDLKSNGDIPLVERLKSEPLAEVWGEILGNDGTVDFESESDLNIPAYMRRNIVR
ncbi:MAG TPA: cell division protein FtsZ [bacterium]|nr:cell division protein FtsZ [bacterium]